MNHIISILHKSRDFLKIWVDNFCHWLQTSTALATASMLTNSVSLPALAGIHPSTLKSLLIKGNTTFTTSHKPPLPALQPLQVWSLSRRLQGLWLQSPLLQHLVLQISQGNWGCCSGTGEQGGHGDYGAVLFLCHHESAGVVEKPPLPALLPL